MALAERHWRFKHWDKGLVRVLGMDEQIIRLETGEAVKWRTDDLLMLDDERIELYYRVRHKVDRWIPWKRGSLTQLAVDMGRPDLKESIRAARSLAGKRAKR